MVLYNDGIIRLNSDLLIGLVQALMVLGEEMGPVKGSLREAELGKFQLSILSRDHLVYVAVHDAYDSEPFTRDIMENVVLHYHHTFASSNLTTQIDREDRIRRHVAELLQTMKFPQERLEQSRQMVLQFIEQQKAHIDTLFLADLDDGVIDIILKPDNDMIIKILMEILSEIPFERHWIGQSKLAEPADTPYGPRDYELWLIYRVAETDYCVMGRAYYSSENEREGLINNLDNLVIKLDRLIN